MWKWIGGALLVIAIALAGTCYAGYRKLTGGGDSVTVTMRSAPERVFTSLTSPDSMMAWMPPGTEVTPSGKSAFQVGDTIRVSAPAGANSTARQPQLLVVRELHAPASFVVDAIQFNPSGTPHVIYTRRDSVVAAGDSTRIVSTFIIGSDPMGVTVAPSTGGTRRTMIGVAEKLLVGAGRMMTEVQLKQLKSHIEQP